MGWFGTGRSSGAGVGQRHAFWRSSVVPGRDVESGDPTAVPAASDIPPMKSEDVLDILRELQDSDKLVLARAAAEHALTCLQTGSMVVQGCQPGSNLWKLKTDCLELAVSSNLLVTERMTADKLMKSILLFGSCSLIAVVLGLFAYRVVTGTSFLPSIWGMGADIVVYLLLLLNGLFINLAIPLWRSQVMNLELQATLYGMIWHVVEDL